MRKSLVFGAGIAGMIATSLLGVAPASAASGGTTLTVALTGGSLSITVPAGPVALSGSAAFGTVLTASIPTSTVTDDRGTLLGWTVVGSTTTDLLATATGDTHSIVLDPALPALPPLSVVMTTPTAVGTSLLTGVTAGAGGPVYPTSTTTLETALLGDGGGSYSYSGTVTFIVPSNAYADNYSTTLTQTVS